MCIPFNQVTLTEEPAFDGDPLCVCLWAFMKVTRELSTKSKVRFFRWELIKFVRQLWLGDPSVIVGLFGAVYLACRIVLITFWLVFWNIFILPNIWDGWLIDKCFWSIFFGMDYNHQLVLHSVLGCSMDTHKNTFPWWWAKEALFIEAGYGLPTWGMWLTYGGISLTWLIS